MESRPDFTRNFARFFSGPEDTYSGAVSASNAGSPASSDLFSGAILPGRDLWFVIMKRTKENL